MFLEAYLGTYSKEMSIASNDIFAAIIFGQKTFGKFLCF
jgi:hypothetical protein